MSAVDHDGRAPAGPAAEPSAIARAMAAQRRAQLLAPATLSVVERCRVARNLRVQHRLDRERVRLSCAVTLRDMRQESEQLRARLRDGALAADALRVLVRAPEPLPAPPASPMLPRHLRGVLELIDGDLTADLTTSTLAAAAYLTPRALQLGFRRHLGLTPGQYVRQQRLRRAREQLQRGDEDVTVSSVAAALGFANAGRFAAAYRDQWGESPGATLRAARRQAPGLR